MANCRLEEYTDVLLNLEDTIPIAVRHTLGLKESDSPVSPQGVDMTVAGGGRRHTMPVLITAMSFGSQGELAYKAYAEAAKRLDILCVNGEGGELPELMGLYPHNRGQQVASARFGVNASFLNSTGLIEIKIGQGAKPGEGRPFAGLQGDRAGRRRQADGARRGPDFPQQQPRPVLHRGTWRNSSTNSRRPTPTRASR